MKKRIVRIILPAVISVIGEQSLNFSDCFAITYLSIEQAQEVLAPKIIWETLNIKLSEQRVEAIEEAAGSSFSDIHMKVWKSANNEFFIVDNVLGKHEYISYAVLIDSSGQIKGVEILDYRESYGDQIRRPEWRNQFQGKTTKDSLELNEDILNISGATISCSNVSKGIKRLLITYDLILKNWEKND